MLIALFCILVLSSGGGGLSAGESFVKQLDKLVGKQVQDPVAKAEAKAAVGEMRATFKDYDARLKQTAARLARLNESDAVSTAEFENTTRVLDGARGEAFERLVAARAKLRAAIPAAQWDGIVGAAARTKP
jgi:hypothetical protein